MPLHIGSMKRNYFGFAHGVTNCGQEIHGRDYGRRANAWDERVFVIEADLGISLDPIPDGETEDLCRQCVARLVQTTRPERW